ncbi:hypothetical protein ACFL1H_02665 [Nanoarchaeota archaeon]
MALPAYDRNEKLKDIAGRFSSNPCPVNSLDKLTRLLNYEEISSLINWEQAFDKYLLSGNRDAAGLIVGYFADKGNKKLELKLKYHEINNKLPEKDVVEIYSIGLHGKAVYYIDNGLEKKVVRDMTQINSYRSSNELIFYMKSDVPEHIVQDARKLEPSAEDI